MLTRSFHWRETSKNKLMSVRKSKLKTVCRICKIVTIEQNFLKHLSTIERLINAKENVQLFRSVRLLELTPNIFIGIEEEDLSAKYNYEELNRILFCLLIFSLLFERKMKKISELVFCYFCKEMAINTKEHVLSKKLLYESQYLEKKLFLLSFFCTFVGEETCHGFSRGHSRKAEILLEKYFELPSIFYCDTCKSFTKEKIFLSHFSTTEHLSNINFLNESFSNWQKKKFDHNLIPEAVDENTAGIIYFFP